MRLEEALLSSTVQAAYRPFYSLPVAPSMEKFVVARTVNGYTPDYYIVYSDTFKYWRQLDGTESHKVANKQDWEPVAPTGG